MARLRVPRRLFCRRHGLVWQQRPGGDPDDKPFVIDPGDGGTA
ncbi:hypothetical protein GZL_00523 [Streptomyces sp. 769]|nr:hypothetical protein GZL_00523 [Streptomyces sp. 769]